MKQLISVFGSSLFISCSQCPYIITQSVTKYFFVSVQKVSIVITSRFCVHSFHFIHFSASTKNCLNFLSFISFFILFYRSVLCLCNVKMIKQYCEIFFDAPRYNSGIYRELGSFQWNNVPNDCS